MVELWIEAIGLISATLYFGRWFFQIHSSTKARKSINPPSFWIITILAGFALMIYTTLLGSLVLPFAYLFTVGVAVYNMRLSKKEKQLSVEEYYDKEYLNYDKSMRAKGEFYDVREKELLKQFLKGKKIKEAVDLGCGTGRITRYLEKLGIKTLGVDVSKQMVSIAEQQKGDYLVADVEKFVSFKKNFGKQDLVLFFGLTSFIKNFGGFVKAINRNSKASNLFFDFVNKRALAPNIKFVNSGVKRKFYKLEEINKILEQNGFELIKVHGVGFVPLPKKILETSWVKQACLFVDRLLSNNRFLTTYFAYRIVVEVKRKQNRVVVVGTIPPYTGGIAHSNATLCNNFSKSNEVTAISFSFLYPKLLYSGKKQTTKEKVGQILYKKEFILNPINPVTWFQTAKRINEIKPSWLVLQWWHTYFFPCYYAIILLTRAKVNIVCQNVLPHEKGFIHKPLTKTLFNLATHLTALSKSDLKEAKQLCPKIKSDYIIEGTYDGVIGNRVLSKVNARKELKIKNKRVLLCFGAVREYKDLGTLIKAMSIVVKTKKDLLLIIAGAFWYKKKEYLQMIKSFGLQKNILIIDKYVSNKEAETLFKASDATILSHKTATESGIPQIAFAYNTPLIATSVGGNPDLIKNKVNGLLVSPQNPVEMAKAINTFYTEKLEPKFRKRMKNMKYLFEWTKEKEKKFFGGK